MNGWQQGLCPACAACAKYRESSLLAAHPCSIMKKAGPPGEKTMKILQRAAPAARGPVG